MKEALSTEPVQTETEKPKDTAQNSPVPFKVGLNEAARLTGASKTTILKYAEEGKLSFEFNGAQKKVYQVAELQRVFGELKVQNGAAKEQQDQIEPQEQDTETALKVALLEEKLRHAEELSQLFKQQAERAEREAEKWQQQAERATLMLTHRPEPTPTPEAQTAPQEPERKSRFRIFGGNR